MWFQQDGATSYTARVTINLLKGEFGERVMVYTNKPATLDDLKDNIQRERERELSHAENPL